MDKSDLQPHEQRLIDERDQLSERVDRLHAFISTGKAKALGQPHHSLLGAQYAVMASYRDILSLRIDLMLDRQTPTA